MAMKEIDLLQGTLDLLVLKTLNSGPMHGYRIAARIQELSNEVLRIEEGSLYPALYRLEQKGVIQSEWGMTDNNRKAKFYKLTRAGRRQVEREAKEWERTTEIVARFLSKPSESR